MGVWVYAFVLPKQLYYFQIPTSTSFKESFVVFGGWIDTFKGQKVFDDFVLTRVACKSNRVVVEGGRIDYGNDKMYLNTSISL